MTAAPRRAPHNRDAASRPVACPSMRPATSLAIGLLLLVILVAGVIALTRV
jgi:hypothetical protein